MRSPFCPECLSADRLHFIKTGGELTDRFRAGGRQKQTFVQPNRTGSFAPSELPFNELILTTKAATGVVLDGFNLAV